MLKRNLNPNQGPLTPKPSPPNRPPDLWTPVPGRALFKEAWVDGRHFVAPTERGWFVYSLICSIPVAIPAGAIFGWPGVAFGSGVVFGLLFWARWKAIAAWSRAWVAFSMSQPPNR